MPYEQDLMRKRDCFQGSCCLGREGGDTRYILVHPLLRYDLINNIDNSFKERSHGETETYHPETRGSEKEPWAGTARF